VLPLVPHPPGSSRGEFAIAGIFRYLHLAIKFMTGILPTIASYGHCNV
jgi:hypothetical protein